MTKRLVLAAVAVAVLLSAAVSAALAQWPTTCVELNDLAEAAAGNVDNVGIYQRTYGEQAEAVCQAEHRNDFFFGARPFATPPKTDPAGFTQAFVERAIDRYNADGMQAAIDYYNAPESMDGRWYVFIVDADGVTRAHPNPEIRGRRVTDVRGLAGYPNGALIAAAAAEGGAWTSDVLTGADGQLETKHYWLVRYDGLIFGSGWYEPGPSKADDPAAYTQTLVQRAVSLYDAVGRDETFAHYGSPQSVDGPWYVYVADAEGTLLSHPIMPELVGVEDLRGTDGFPIARQSAAAASEDGGWVHYTWTNPETGTAQTKHSWNVLHDGLIFGSGWYEPAPTKDDPAAFTQAFVQQAVNLYEAAGRDEAFAYYGSPQSVDGPWYVFVVDAGGELLVHAASPQLVGQSLRGPLGTDSAGYAFGADILAADEAGRWVSYIFDNPETGQAGLKHSWVLRRGDLIFGTGWYEPVSDAAAFTQSYVAKAVQVLETDGRQAVLDYANAPASVQGPWYTFIIDRASGAIVAHGTRPERLGRTLDILVDVSGYHYGADFAQATAQGRWVDYIFLNTVTGAYEQKHSWVVEREGLIIGSGWYEPIDRDADPARFTQAFVAKALRLHETDGRQAAIDYYNAPASVQGPWYIFIIDKASGAIVAHGTRPERLGRTLDILVDVSGYHYGADFAQATAQGRWVDYIFLNTVTGAYEQKHSWVVEREGLIIGSGWYEPIDRDADPARFTQAFVAKALRLHETDGRQAAIDYYNTTASVDGPWYVFVADASGEMLAHAVSPQLIGQSLSGPLGTDSTGYVFGADILAADETGRWVDYVFLNPTTGQEGTKHSWVVRRGDLIFGSGWYE